MSQIFKILTWKDFGPLRQWFRKFPSKIFYPILASHSWKLQIGFFDRRATKICVRSFRPLCDKERSQKSATNRGLKSQHRVPGTNTSLLSYFVVDDVIVYFPSQFTFCYHFLSFSHYWRCLYPTYTLPYLILYLTSYLTFCYLTSYLNLPHILLFITLHLTLPYRVPYLTFCLTLPYFLPFLTLTYVLPCLTFPYILTYLTLPQVCITYVIGTTGRKMIIQTANNDRGK